LRDESELVLSVIEYRIRLLHSPLQCLFW